MWFDKTTNNNRRSPRLPPKQLENVEEIKNYVKYHANTRNT